MSLAAPQTTRYRPEEILVAKSFDVAGNSEVTWDAWRRIPPNFMVFRAFATEQTHDARVRVTADAEPNVYDEHADACQLLSDAQLADVFAHRLMLVSIRNQSAVAMTDYQFRYRYLVDNWTVAEKIRRGVLKVEKKNVAELEPTGVWTSEELRLTKKFNLIENVFSGRLPYQFPYNRDTKLEQNTNIRIQDVARCLDTVPAGSVLNPALQVDIGARITVPEDEKIILFEIASEVPADPADGTYIVVDRDIDQPSYMFLNTWCFSGIGRADNLWVPALEEMYIHARSTVGETNFHVRYKYLRAKLTLIDKIKWNLDMEPSEIAVCDKMDLWDRCAAGIEHKPLPV